MELGTVLFWVMLVVLSNLTYNLSLKGTSLPLLPSQERSPSRSQLFILLDFSRLCFALISKKIERRKEKIIVDGQQLKKRAGG